MKHTRPEDIHIHSLDINDMIGVIPAGIIKKEVLIILATLVALGCIAAFVALPAVVKAKLTFYPDVTPVAVPAGPGGVVHSVAVPGGGPVRAGDCLLVYRSAGDPERMLALDTLLRTKGPADLRPRDLAGFGALGAVQRPFDAFKGAVGAAGAGGDGTTAQPAVQARREAHRALLSGLAAWKKQYVVAAPVAGRLLLDPHLYPGKAVRAGTVPARIAPPVQKVTCTALVANQPGVTRYVRAGQSVKVRFRGIAPAGVVQAGATITHVAAAGGDRLVLELTMDKSFIRLFNDYLVQTQEPVESELVVAGNPLLANAVNAP
jgi:hypothetical protein